jgi:hypothetical protein
MLPKMQKGVLENNIKNQLDERSSISARSNAAGRKAARHVHSANSFSRWRQRGD